MTYYLRLLKALIIIVTIYLNSKELDQYVCIAKYKSQTLQANHKKKGHLLATSVKGLKVRIFSKNLLFHTNNILTCIRGVSSKRKNTNKVSTWYILYKIRILLQHKPPHVGSSHWVIPKKTVSLVFPELGGYKVSINTHSPKGIL